MKKLYLLSSLLFLLSACSLFVDKGATRKNINGESGIWVSAYFGAWNHYAPPGGNWGNLPTDAIDWDAFTHLIYFSLTAKPDGTLSDIKKYETFSPSRINAIVAAAHEHDTPVLFTVGGWGNYPGFRSAIMPENRANFIAHILQVLDQWGFDGVDIDMEPIKDEQDVQNYKAFIDELHQQLQDRTTPLGNRPLLTAATAWKPDLFASLADQFDQINLMTYDLSGAWRGWVSWHNSPIYDGGNNFESTGRPLPSADNEIEEFRSAGIPKEKLGIGIDFYGYIWSGFVIKPLQTWITPPVVTPNVPFYQIMDEYFEEEYYRWDDEAKAAYLSIDSPIPLEKKFISYDHHRSIQEKINYARQKGIGGVIIWELSGGYRKDQPEGEKDLLLQTVKKELNQ